MMEGGGRCWHMLAIALLVGRLESLDHRHTFERDCLGICWLLDEFSGSISLDIQLRAGVCGFGFGVGGGGRVGPIT